MGIQDVVRAYSLREAVDIPLNVFGNRLSSEAILALSLYNQHNPAVDVKDFIKRYWIGEEDTRILAFLQDARENWKIKETLALKDSSGKDRILAHQLISSLDEMRKAGRDLDYEGLLENFWNGFDELERISNLLFGDQRMAYTLQSGAIFLIASYTVKQEGVFVPSDEYWTGFSYLHTGCCDTKKRQIIIRPRACACMQELLLSGAELLPMNEREVFYNRQIMQEELIYWHERGHLVQGELFGKEIKSLTSENTIVGTEDYADLTAAILLEKEQGKDRAEEFLMIDALGDKIMGKDVNWKIISATIDGRRAMLKSKYSSKMV